MENKNLNLFSTTDFLMVPLCNYIAFYNRCKSFTRNLFCKTMSSSFHYF